MNSFDNETKIISLAHYILENQTSTYEILNKIIMCGVSIVRPVYRLFWLIFVLNQVSLYIQWLLSSIMFLEINHLNDFRL